MTFCDNYSRSIIRDTATPGRLVFPGTTLRSYMGGRQIIYQIENPHMLRMPMHIMMHRHWILSDCLRFYICITGFLRGIRFNGVFDFGFGYAFPTIAFG